MSAHNICFYGEISKLYPSYHQIPSSVPLFYDRVMPTKDAGRMANSVDNDQIAPQEQSDVGLHCLPRTGCPKTLN